MKNKFQFGCKVKTVCDIPSVDGMLYKNEIVTIDENHKDIREDKIRVKDSLGKIWWVKPSQVT